MPAVPLYDALAADYDRFVNWEARLAHELPFFLSLFNQAGVRRVLDSACGTGHHAIALARHGYDVVGADLSPAMVEQARQNAAAAGVRVPFVQAGLGDLAKIEPEGEGFDAVLCLGNSLPHLLSRDAVNAALADFAAVLHPGGLLVIQNRNFDKVWAEKQRFMPPQAYRDAGGEWIFVRFYDFEESEVVFNMVRLRRTPEGGWAQDVDATRLRPIFGDELALGLRDAGFDRVELYGGYDRTPFDRESSGDLLAVAQLTP